MVIQLVNIDVLEDIQKIQPVIPVKTKPKQHSKDIITPVVITDDLTTENFIAEKMETEFEKITETDVQENNENEQTAHNAYLARDYVQHNYNYISRRIRDKLIYPPLAKRTGIQGRAEIIFTIQADGTASGLMLNASSGDDFLDAAAINAVKAAAPFNPPPAPVRLAVPVVFSLR